MHNWKRVYFAVIFFLVMQYGSAAQQPQSPAPQPWMNTSLSSDARAHMVLQQMTLHEKIGLLHGTGQPGNGPVTPEGKDSIGGAGFVVGVPRLGIPGIQMADAAYGVTKSGTYGRYSTAMPSNLALAASWSLDAADEYGALIGRELRAQGYNMTLGGGVDLARELRNGRNFEYGGEDPLLAGTMVGESMRSLQAQHIIGDLKHYALNDQESGRNFLSANMDERSMRETDLLAFQIALARSKAGAVMCSYNRVNGDFACENKHLLTDILKGDWKFQGFVVSDWGGTHSTAKASAAGLDNEEAHADFFGDALKAAVLAGTVPQSEIDDHALRILRSEFESGIIDYPVKKSVPDVETDLAIAQHVEEQSIVLLKNDEDLLPLQPERVHRIVLIGGHADVGMLSGGGSAQVDPPAGNAIKKPGEGQTHWMDQIWFPTSPLKALRERLPNAEITFDPGTDAAKAAESARTADIAIVFAYQWESESMDLPSLDLPDHQNELIALVAAANPHTLVVLETGSAITMPWIQHVPGVVEAWFSGSRGAEALANILMGKINPSGKLPITFPVKEADLPHPVLVKPPPRPAGANRQPPHTPPPPFDVDYSEGLKVGYKWYDAQGLPVLFPFGYGLSYTFFHYAGLQVDPNTFTVRFHVSNTGKRAGEEIAEVYISLPSAAAEPPKRLVGWSKVMLQPGEDRELSVSVDRQSLSIYDVKQNQWRLVPGEYGFMVGGSSKDLPLKNSVSLH
jgi:beta-glucosidase